MPSPFSELPAGEVPGRFELGVARRDGTLDQILQEVTASVQTTKRTESQSIVQMAMNAAETENMNTALEKRIRAFASPVTGKDR